MFHTELLKLIIWDGATKFKDKHIIQSEISFF